MFVAELERRVLSLKRWESEELPVSIVHGDPWPGNTLYSGQSLVALIDWEEVTLGPAIFDLAYVAMCSCFPDGNYDPAIFDALIASYVETRALSDSERRCFPDALQRVACTCCLWLILRSGEAEARVEQRTETMA